MENKFSARLESQRQKMGFTMAQIADLVGVSEATVSRWIGGQRKKPAATQAFALARALDLDVMYLLGVSDEPGAFSWPDIDLSRSSDPPLSEALLRRASAILPSIQEDMAALKLAMAQIKMNPSLSNQFRDDIKTRASAIAEKSSLLSKDVADALSLMHPHRDDHSKTS